MKKTLSWITLLLIFNSCSSAPKTPKDIPVAAFHPTQETVVILGTNDIHGTLFPISSKTREADGISPVVYERGGLALLSGYMNILKNEYGPKLLLLDAGDQFQGSIESNLEEGAPMVKFFNFVGLRGSAIGNHEFDFGPEGPEGTPGDPLGALKKRMTEAQYPYLAANVLDKKTGAFPDFPNAKTRNIYSVGSLKVGVIGESTLETPTSTRAEFVKDLSFTNLKEALLRESKALKSDGADIVILTAHSGMKCELGQEGYSLKIRKESDVQGECDSKYEMSKLLKSLPDGVVDAVVSGHTHQVVHHWVNGIPVIQGASRGQYFNLIYLTFDKSTHKVVKEFTRIEGPVPVCSKVFGNQQDCNGDLPAPRHGRGDLENATFHGVRVRADGAVESLLEPTAQKVAAQKSQVVGQAARTLENSRFGGETDLGNLITDVLRDATQADVAIMNPGGIRAPIDAGPITYESVFRAFPFDNSISLLHVTGQELKLILRLAESGARGFFPISGAKLRVLDPSVDAPSNDLNGDQKIQAWETNRLLEVTLANGEKIKDSKIYRLATLDFLVTGGDDMGYAMSRVDSKKIEMAASGIIRDVFVRYLQKAGPVNTIERPLIDPKNRRIVFEKTKPNASKAKRRRARR